MVRNTNQKGFTIIELLVAMVAFSSMVMIASITILQISRMYYKGVNASKTQETVRTILAQVTNEVQLSQPRITSGILNVDVNGDSVTDTVVLSRCVGSNMYSYILDRRVSPDTPHALWKSNSTNPNRCQPVDITSPSLTDGVELLDSGMRLTSFTIVAVDAADNNSLVNVSVGLLYGEDDVILRGDNPDTAAVETDWAGCRAGIVGAEWCAFARLDTQLLRRLTGTE